MLSENGKVLVAVLDTGYDNRSYNETRVTDGVDFSDAQDGLDTNGHGTAMANIILNYTKDDIKVMPVKVADENGNTSSLKLYMGIRYAIEHGADIINISMSAYHSSGSNILHQAICEAKWAGIFVVVSAGNAGCDVSDFSPANEEDAIVVSAVNVEKTLAKYSNYGPYVDYCAYGTIEIPGIKGEYVKQTGTSVAAALVSAAIAEQKMYHKNSTYDS